ncbi:MAG: DUF2911 domain-containing protein [Candidatus Eisenbacteria bacterium]
MRIRASVLALGLAALTLVPAAPARAQLKLPRISPNATVTQTIGITDLTVTYSRPGVKGRTVWGDIVPMDKPWRAGANEATRFTTTDEITFGGQKLAAGTYALIAIPGKDEWTIALNSEKELWGAYEYKPEKDVLRVKVKPEAAPHEEWLSFSFDGLAPATATSMPNATNLVLRWEKLRVAVPVSVDANATILAGCRKAVGEAKPDDFRTRVQAARWCLDSGVNMDEARGWMTQAVAIQKNYSTLGLQARFLAKEGKKQEAIAAGEAAVAAGKASPDKPDTSAIEKLVAEWKAAK